MNVHEDSVDEFNQWYDNEHMEQARAIPGFRANHRRYEALTFGGKYWTYRPDPRFTALYELRSEADLQSSIDSDEYAAWSGDFLRRWRARTENEVSIMCEQIFGADAPLDFRLVLIAQMNVDPEREEEFNQWYNEIHIPQAGMIPGFGTDHRRFGSFELRGKHWHYRPNPRYTALYEILPDTDVQEAIDSDEYREWSGDFLARWRTGTSDEVSTICRRIY
jgi:hypothetical protein